MKRSVRFFVGLACVLSVMLTGLCACTGSRPASTVTLDPIDDGGLAGRPTVAVPYGQMTLLDVMSINEPSIAWSRLSKYTHSLHSGTTATFLVADTYGGELELKVEFDAQKDQVNRADLHYGELAVSILTDDNAVLDPIFEAIRQHYSQQPAPEAAE